MTEETNQKSDGLTLRQILTRAEDLIAILYAISLPLSMTASYTLLICGLVLWASSFILNLLRPTADKSEPKLAPFAIPLLLFAAALILSGLFNGTEQYGNLGNNSLKAAIASLTNFKSMLPYFWAFHIFSKPRKTGILAVWLLLMVSSVAGVWGTIQQIFDIHPGFKYLQGTGFLGGPMAFAGQMQIFSLLALGLFISGAYKKASATDDTFNCLKVILRPLETPFVFACIVLANFLGVLFAAERSAWLGTFIGVLVIAGFKSWKLLAKMIAGLSLLSWGLWSFVPVVKVRMSSLFQVLSGGHDASIDARFTIWRSCLELFSQSAIFGTGIFRFPHFNIQGTIVPGVSTDLNHGHSNYLHILAATGLVGFISFLGLFIYIFSYIFAQLKISLKSTDSVRSGLLLGMLGAITSLMISGIFEYNFGTAQVRLAEWFLLGLI